MKIVERKFWKKGGTEGPKHDPYGYDEYCLEETVVFDNGQKDTHFFMLHLGLTCWFEWNINNKVVQEIEDENVAINNWERRTKLTIEQAEKIKNKSLYRCPKCQSKKGYRYASGFPGETLLICRNCKSVVDSHLNMAAIM